MRDDASESRQPDAIARDRQRIAEGQRPAYHATWSVSAEGSLDVRVTELPIIHLFVPDRTAITDGARLLIARTLDVAPDAFDVAVDRLPSDG